jgi:hypothetical protein
MRTRIRLIDYPSKAQAEAPELNTWAQLEEERVTHLRVLAEQVADGSLALKRVRQPHQRLERWARQRHPSQRRVEQRRTTPFDAFDSVQPVHRRKRRRQLHSHVPHAATKQSHSDQHVKRHPLLRGRCQCRYRCKR